MEEWYTIPTIQGGGLVNKFVIAFVIYYPDDGFFERIKLLMKSGFSLIIFNNGLSEEYHDALIEIASNNIIILGDGSNVGLAKSINELNVFSVQSGYDYLILFDQDTLIGKSFYSSISSIPLKKYMRGEYTSLQILSENDSRYSNTLSSQEVLFNINSGSIFDLNLIQKIGYHDESFFVEGVDYYLGVHSRANGFKVGILNGVVGLDHFSNQDDSVVEIMGRKVKCRIYPFSRVRDVFVSHAKLIRYSVSNFDIKSCVRLVRYLIVFNLNNILSSVIKFLGK